MLLAVVFSVLGYSSAFSQDANARTQEKSWVEHMQNPEGNVYEAEKSFNRFWEGKDLTAPRATKGKGYKIFYRWRNFVEPRVYPSGNKVSPAIAIKEFENFRMNNPERAFKASASSNARSANGAWTLVGPTNPGGSVANGSYQSPGGSGRVNAIAVDPNDSNIIWVGTPAGGLWKTTNGGSSWVSMTDDLPVIGVSSIVIDPTNSNVMYIGTGDRDAGDTYSIGVLKSTDGGNTWNNTALTYSVSDKKRVSKIIMDPNNSNTLVIACTDGIYKSINGLSTVSTVASGTFYFDIEYHPTNSNTMYAAGGSFYRSTNGGDSWSEVTSGLNSGSTYRYEIAVSPAAANNVWVVAANNTDYGLQAFYTSTNSGSSFSNTYSSGNLLGWSTAHNDSGGQGWYDLTLAVNPSNANEIFMGGVNLQKSTNGGSSWTTNGYWLDGSSYEYVHADHHFTMYLNSSTVLSGNDGGLFKSTNNGSTWTDYSNNMSIAQIAGMGNSATNANLIMTGMQDNGTNKYNGSTWSIVGGGDGGETMIEPGNDNNMYRSYVNGAIYRSTNGGSSWSDMRPGSASGGAWVTPMVVHPSTYSTIYSGYSHLWRSTNRGVSWTKTGNTLNNGNILRIAIAPSNPDYIYIIKQYRSSTTSYYVQRSTNGGSSWTTIESGLPMANAAPTDLIVSPTNPSQMFITFSGYSAGEKVYETTNAGSSYTNLSGNLPNIPANAVVYETGSNDAVYVGTDVGVYYRSDDTGTWELFSQDLPNVIIRELEIYYDAVDDNSRLRAGTYGRSLWETPLKSGVPVVCNADVPTGLASSNVGSATADLNWDAVSGATYDVRYKATSSSTWSTSTVSSTSTTLSGLAASTQYEAQVRSKCDGGATSAYSSSINFITTEIQLVYCDSQGSRVTYEWIDYVAFGGMANSTGANEGYGDFTSQTATVVAGTSNEITVSAGFASSAYNEHFNVWIDFNHNGTFESSELTDMGMNNSSGNRVANIDVPSSAFIGDTRMRVSMKYNGAPTACEAIGDGEVEDYTVSITAGSVDNEAPSVPNGLASSNLAETSFTLTWTASTDNIGVSGYDVYVNGSLDGSSATTSYNVTGLSVNTTYAMTVVAKDAAGNVSAASSALNVTTPDQTAPSVPSGLASANTTQTSTDLSWTASTDNVGVSSYEVLVDGVVNGSTATTSYSVSGLAASTTYAMTVRAQDAAGNPSSSSASINVTTLDPIGGGCSGGISSFPYAEGFESGIGAWTQSSSDDIDWTVDASGTPSSSTGPSSATEGSYYLYIESSGNGTGYPNKVAIFNSPCIDLTAETAATFSFSYHMYGSSMGTMDLQASTNGTTWTSLWSMSGNQGNSWSSSNIDLAAYAGGAVELRYVGTTSTSYRSDMAIDKLKISTGSTGGCTDVTLTLTLDNYPAETSWTVTDDQGSTVMSGGSYHATNDKGVTKADVSCLEDGCYTFTINDTYGDGICCSYGNGSYSLSDGSTTLASGGSFTSSDATNFCIGGGVAQQESRLTGILSDTQEKGSAPLLYPNPVRDYLNVTVPRGMQAMRVYTTNGVEVSNIRVMSDGIDVSRLNAGVYTIMIETEKGVIIEKFIKK